MYCLDSVPEEPLLPDFFNSPVMTQGNTPNERFDYQLLFTNIENTDVIGMRMFTNRGSAADSVNPGLWYTLEAANPVSGYSTIDVNGYSAIRVGTSTYIAGSNIDGGYTNIYLLSYNEGAEQSTIDIYDQIIENILINDQIGNVYDPDNQACSYNPEYVARDTVRVNGIGTAKYYLANFFSSGLGNNNYPALNNGTYIKNMTTSAWPSWSAKLGNDLSTGLPVDPINTFGTCDGANYEAATCWNAQDKLFTVPDGSYVYLYRANNGGDGYGLYANLEYTAGPWLNYSGDPCSGFSEVQGGCNDRFNYEISR